MSFRSKLRKVLLMTALVYLSACGKYGPPLPPEYLSPRPVNELTATADQGGVKISWQNPSEDLRGKPLKSLGGYYIYRRVLEGELTEDRKKKTRGTAGIFGGKKDFVLLGNVPDFEIETLKEIKRKAQDEGRTARRLKAPENLKKHDFLDKDVQPGKVYIYRVVPFNQGDVEGGYKKVIRVIFDNERSQVDLVDDTAEGGEDYEKAAEE